MDLSTLAVSTPPSGVLFPSVSSAPAMPPLAKPGAAFPLALAPRQKLALVVSMLDQYGRAPLIGRIDGATPGCYHLPMSGEEYHRRAPGISSTGLKAILRSPAHYRAEKLAQDDRPALALGRAAHALLFEPHTFDGEFIVWTGGRRSGGEWAAFSAANATKTILTQDERDQAQRIADAALAAPCFPTRKFLAGARRSDGSWILEPARTEFSVFWTDEETGLLLKVRFDALSAIGLDLKTCPDATPEAFGRDAYKFHYDLSAALYVEGAKRFLGQEIPFAFLAVEKDAPHGVWLHDADAEFLEHGRRKLRVALRRYADCIATDKWPAYGAEARTQIGPPPRWLQFAG